MGGAYLYTWFDYLSGHEERGLCSPPPTHGGVGGWVGGWVEEGAAGARGALHEVGE